MVEKVVRPYLDILGCLYLRGLNCLVERILAAADARTVAACHRVCKAWQRDLCRAEVWRRLFTSKCSLDPSLLRACRLLDWRGHVGLCRGKQEQCRRDRLQEKGEYMKDMLQEEEDSETDRLQEEEKCKKDRLQEEGEYRRERLQEEEQYRRLLYITTNYPGQGEIHSPTRIITGGLYSVLKLHKDMLLAGMLDGLIKVWQLARPGRPLRVLEGHEQRVTALDTRDSHLVSGSLDHTVRIWSLETGAMLRVLQTGEVVCLQLQEESLVWVTASGSLKMWSWDGRPHRCLAVRSTKLGLRPVPELLGLSPRYCVAARRADREVAVYSIATGALLPDRDVICGGEVSCLALNGSLLALAWATTVEVWDLSQVCCTAVLSSTLARLSPSLLLLSDYMMIVLLPSGRLSHWPLASLLPPPCSPPIRLDLDFPHATIESQDPVWCRPCLTTSGLVLGSQARLGDLRLWRWSLGESASSLSSSPLSSPMLSKSSSKPLGSFLAPQFRYKYDCDPDCRQCRPPSADTTDVIDLK